MEFGYMNLGAVKKALSLWLNHDSYFIRLLLDRAVNESARH